MRASIYGGTVPIPHWVTGVNRRFTNRVMLRLSDDVPPLATLHHTGRRSGRRYRTPVLAFPTERGIVIALTYGPDVDWLRNVLAGPGPGSGRDGDGPRGAGARTRLVRRRRVLALDDPVRLHGSDGARLVPAWTRAALRALAVDEFVELRTGALARAG